MPSNKKLLQAAAGSAGGDPLYVEDVFSTYLYDGNSSTNVITNGIDLAGEGGLVWGKSRDNAFSHMLIDTVRGGDKGLSSNATSAEYDNNTMITSFNSNGFTLGSYLGLNYNGDDVVSWSFRKAEKFFDVVTYTGTGSNQTISHNLGSVPGCIIARSLSGDNWYVWHNSLSTSGAGASTGHKRLILNSTAAEESRNGINTITSTSFAVLGSDGEVGGNGTSYVAYVFANDAGGFGDDGDENIIKCGSWNENSTNNVTIDCGFEPDFVMFKCADAASSWYMADSMRTVPTPSSGTATGNYIDTILQANSNAAEGSANAISLTSTGFIWYADGRLTNTAKWIYIAIRRPMKTPESGTEVFSPVAYSGNSTAGRSITSGFPLDAVLTKGRNAGIEPILYSRLQGSGRKLLTYSTAAEANSSTNVITSFDQDGMTVGTDTDINNSSYTYIDYFFKRATGFMDVVAYTGTGSNRTIAHNLGVAPSMMVIKRRDGSGYGWPTWHSGYSLYSTPTYNTYMRINSNAAVAADATLFNSTLPTESVFSVGSSSETNQNNGTYIAYLFGEIDGVSKFGSYTGTGSNIDIDCGFSAGARFILIKRLTPGAGDWFVFDTARGIVAGNDPYFYLNSSAAENTGDYIDPLASGFTITSGAFWINIDTYKYIFWAIA